MCICRQTPQNSKIKLNQTLQDQHELDKIKNHLKVKRKLYNPTEYNNINQHISQCRNLLKIEKSNAIREQANEIVRKRSQNLIKMQLEGNARDKMKYNKRIVGVVSSKTPNFNLNKRSKTEITMGDSTIIEYQLAPNLCTHSQQRANFQSNNKLTEPREKKNHNKASKKLSNNIYLFGKEQSHIQKSKQTSGIQMTPQTVKRIENSKRHNILTIKPREMSKNTQDATFNNSFHHRQNTSQLDKLREKRRQVREKQLKELTTQNSSFYEKNQKLKRLYNRYEQRYCSGEEQASNMMQKVNIARANVLLKNN